AVVIAREDVAGDKRLVAYVVRNGSETQQESSSSSSQELKSSELKVYLRERLPEYMIPSAIVELEQMPLTPNGKVDRKALPAPDYMVSESVAGYVAPRTVVEEMLAGLWSQVLRVERVGVHENFFELGGHSLLATQLISRVRQSLEVELPLRELFEYPTVASLAERVEAGKSGEQQLPSKKSPLVRIQTAGSKPPFFFVHPPGGSVLCYADLARNLGADRPFYGIQAQGLNGDKDAQTQVERMAARYIEAIRGVQPEGPYNLGGWSMGGVVAFEIAQQLRGQGSEVSLLALLDSWAPHNGNGEKNAQSQLASFASNLGLMPEHITMSLEELLGLEPEQQLACVMEMAKAASLVSPEMTLEDFRSLYENYKVNVKAVQEYSPQPYTGRVALFSASERRTKAAKKRAQDKTQGWGGLAPEGLEIHPVSGHHFNILREPHVRDLARKMNDYVNEFEARNNQA
ncbi:MAG: thioesterase domain-containing protein, partial [Pyrinomonadaceae bacterium]